jgi:hypothetical protein
MEVVRLLNWDQIANYPGYVPTSFTAAFYGQPDESTAGQFHLHGNRGVDQCAD